MCGNCEKKLSYINDIDYRVKTLTVFKKKNIKTFVYYCQNRGIFITSKFKFG